LRDVAGMFRHAKGGMFPGTEFVNRDRTPA
jgi:hypothetical protein